MLTPFQKNNLLQFLNRVELKGIDEANAFMEVVNAIQKTDTEETLENKPETTTETDTPTKVE
jgi:hypothetical protein